MECPTCFQKIVAPHAPATDDPKFILTGTKLGERPIATSITESSSGIAARKKSLRSVTLGRFPIITVIALIALLGAGAAVLVNFAENFFHRESSASGEVEQAKETNALLSPPEPTNTPLANGAKWTLNLDAVTIPDLAVTGYVHGKVLVPQRAILDAGTLTLRTANGGLPDVGISIYLQATRGVNLAGQSIEIKTNCMGAPWIDLRWKSDQGKPLKQTVKGGYAMRLEFGRPVGDRLPGKIYLCTPDEAKSYIAGEFNAKIRKPKTP